MTSLPYHSVTEIQINEYTPDTFLGYHTDNTIAYLGTIFGISLVGDCNLTFRKVPPIPTLRPLSNCRPFL